jgi:transcriptional regulator with PAS, ATPase and Fis domain
MKTDLQKILIKNITENYEITANLVSKIRTNTNRIVEICGEAGVGKFFVLKSLYTELKKQGISFKLYQPYIFRINQFKEIVQLISEISDKKYAELIQNSQKYNFTSKYDFFYFITKELSRQSLFRPSNIIVYECHYLDEYTKDFIQYLAQYIQKENITIITFTREETFAFSEKIKISPIDYKIVKNIINEYYPGDNYNYDTESEILTNIASGNIYIVEYLLKVSENKDEKIDFSSYIDEKLDFDSIYLQKIEELPQDEFNLLQTIFIMDTKASKDILLKIDPKAEKKLNSLSEKGLITYFNNTYTTKRVSPVKQKYLALNQKKRKEILATVEKYIPQELFIDYCFEITNCDPKKLEERIKVLNTLHDYKSLLKIYSFLLKKADDEKSKLEILQQLGSIQLYLNNYQKASSNLRQALKLSINLEKSSEKLVYLLSYTLFSMNSFSLALEIIKKYSPKQIEPFYHWKLTLQKAEIYTQMEDFNLALDFTEEASSLATEFKDSQKRSIHQADCKKQNGLINYYINEWNKAKVSFQEAEKLYLSVNHIEGLAAIYNNLGSLAMLQGNWKKAEQLYLKSLKYEQKRYNLNGISVCYSNLGSLFEDQSNYTKALDYLNKALEIQKLLNDEYKITTFYYNIGITYMDNNQYEKAVQALQESLEIALRFNLFKSVDAALNCLGALYFKSGDWAKAIDYYERAIQKSKANNFSEGLCQSYNNLGELYEKRGEYALAYDFYSKSLDLLSNITDDFMKAEIYGNIGSVLTHLHKFGEAYGYLVESYDFFKSLNAKDEILEGAQKQAFYFIQTRNYESAKYYLDTAMQIAEELKNENQLGNCYYLKGLLAKNSDINEALDHLKNSIEFFILSDNNFDWAKANYQYALLLYEKDEWEQALQILKDNTKIIKKYGAIKFLEKNDTLIQNITKKYKIELKESKQQETLLNKFYEITKELNNISDIEILHETALDKIIQFADADGGIFCLYHNKMVKDNWEYITQSNLNVQDKEFNKLMEIVETTYQKNRSQNVKQPHFAPEYNNIISFPLSVRDDKKGIILLMSKFGSHYFTEKMYNLINALCNQIVVIVENIAYKTFQKSHANIRQELASASNFPNIIGKSKSIQKIFRLIEKISNTPTTVLIEGMSGTGKELIARAIHFNSDRKNKKFIAQYCGALPETLLESELFGHVKGAFTGATHEKKGLFEIADGGTFFLDEIADISMSTQAKLLRFLQEGEIKKVGSTQTQKVDVRVICASNVSLKERVKSGVFREDLYYRLNVIKIDVPPLKDRRSDIPLLIVHFLDKYSKKIGKKINGVTDETMRYLMNYDWPGNIRQLENEIERAVTLADDKSVIKTSDLSEEIFHFQENTETINLLENQSLKDAVEKLEKQMILKTLEENSWNQTQTAKKLKLSRQGLIKKMHRYEIKKNEE